MKLFFTTLLLISAALAQGQGNYCPNFEIPVLGKDLLYSYYRNSVIRIVSGTETGSGYLIDSERGYVITAAHVVRASLDDKTVPITATNLTNADAVENESATVKPFTLKPVANLTKKDIDIALLQLVPADAMKHANALDIALRIPLNSRSSFVFGFPRGQSELSQQTAENMNGNRDGTITVKQAAFPGDSGSPLIDETGKVVATCTERVLTQEKHVSNAAIYIPTAAIVELLDQIPITGRVESIDKSIRAKGLSRDDLVEDLMPVLDRNHLSNLELYSWAYHIWKNPSPQIESQHFPCPILRALVHRKLEDAEERLQKYSDPKTRAVALLSLGQRAEMFDGKGAVAFFKTADKLLSRLPKSEIDEETNQLRSSSLNSLGQFYAQSGDIKSAEPYFRAAASLSGAKDVGKQKPEVEAQNPIDLLQQDRFGVLGSVLPSLSAQNTAGDLLDRVYLVCLVVVLLTALIAGGVWIWRRWSNRRQKNRFTSELIEDWFATKRDSPFELQIATANAIGRALSSGDVNRQRLAKHLASDLAQFARPGGSYWQAERNNAELLNYEIRKFLPRPYSIQVRVKKFIRQA